MKLFRIVLAALLAGVCLAQTAPSEAPKPPADVDQTLRARVNEFYGLLLKREFRKAESLIAEDSKDYYYGIGKPDFVRFELLDIRYSENFTRAIATVQCAQKVQQPGFPMGEWNLKVPSLWKLENGNWYWYIVQDQVMTPVGVIQKGDPHNGEKPPAKPLEIPKTFATTPEFALGKIAADKQMVTVEGDKVEKVTIVNGSSGEIQLVMPKQLGLDLKLEPSSLKSGEKAVLTIRAVQGSYSGIIGLQVVPTQEVIGIRVEVKLPKLPGGER